MKDLTYTQKKPTQDGYYFYRYVGIAGKEIVLMTYVVEAEGVMYCDYDEKYSHPVDEMNGQFAGPIPLPKG